MTDLETRQQRVANGSKRQRDLDAVAPKFDYVAYCKKHFPEENFWPVQAAAFHVRIRNGRRYPDPAAVKARMEEKGWTLAQRKAMP